MKKSVKKLLNIGVVFTVMSLSFNCFAVGAPFLKAIGDKVIGLALKKSFNMEGSKLAANNLELSLKAIFGTIPEDNKEVIGFLKGLESDVEHAANAKKALVLFESDSIEKLTKTELKQGIDAFAFLAGEKGTKLEVVRQCATCASADSIFKYTLHIADSIAMKEALKSVNSTYAIMSNAQIKKAIFKRMQSLGSSMKGIDDIDPNDLKTFMTFLELTKSRYDQFSEIRRFTKSAISVSKNSKGKVALLDPSNGKPWKILDTNPGAETLTKMGKLNELVARYSRRYNVSTEDAFYKVLAKKAKGDPELEGYLKLLKQKNCFFK